MTLPKKVVDAVLLLAHGGPRDLSEVRPLLRRVVKTRPLDHALIADIKERYRQIGGYSPLPLGGYTCARQLERRTGLPIFFATQYWYPDISSALQEMRSRNFERFVALPLSPFFNAFSALGYEGSVRRCMARAASNMHMRFVDSFERQALFSAIWGDAIRAHVRRHQDREKTFVLFTAHSIPLTFIKPNDRYVASLHEAAARIAHRLSLHQSHWTVCFQSAPEDKRKWIGPHIEECLPKIAGHGFKHVVVAPFGFVQDHIETLYDIDISYAHIARRFNMTLSRPPMPIADTRFSELLSAAVQGALA
jgi:ferrochelatase